MHFARGFSRRKFLARTSCSGAFYALAMRLPIAGSRHRLGLTFAAREYIQSGETSLNSCFHPSMAGEQKCPSAGHRGFSPSPMRCAAGACGHPFGEERNPVSAAAAERAKAGVRGWRRPELG